MNDESTPTTPGDADDGSNPGSSTSGTPETADSAGPSGAGSSPTGVHKRRGFVRRHWVMTSLIVALVLVAGSAGGYWYWINHELSSVKRVYVGTIDHNVHPAGQPHEKDRALNILLLGADNGRDTQSVSDDLKDGHWTKFTHRSDTLMIAHIPADRKSVQLVSIPRDTWVKIKGYPYAGGYGKINAAFAYGGPSLAVQTVQQLTGIQIDHMAIIDWAGFKDLSTAVNGVRVYIPRTFYDDSQRLWWRKGWHTFEGQEALAYVRTRHGLANGDFDRIARQQNFIRATMSKVLAQDHNPMAVTRIVRVMTRYLTIDKGWDNGEIINLALSLRNVKDQDVQFLTAPLGTYAMSADGQSIVRLDPKQSRELFRDIKTDHISKYLHKYPDAVLKGKKSVS
jgi:LCP family protein required for cell wall assembly